MAADPAIAQATAPVAGLIAAGRRREHRRRITIGVTAMVAVAGVTATVPRLLHAPDHIQKAASDPAPTPAAPNPAAATSTATKPPTATVTWTTDPDAPKTGPAQAVVGTAYPYDLYTHCDINYAYFDGRWWQAEHELPAPQTKPDPRTGITTYTGYTPGFMTLVSPDTAHFEAPGLATVPFHPMTGRPPACA